MARSRRPFVVPSILAGLGIALGACSGAGGEAVPPPSAAPTQVAACLTFILEEAPAPGLDAYDVQVVAGVKAAVVAELVAAGFAIVESRDKPFDVVLKLTAVPGSRIESDAKLRGTFQVEGTTGPLDTIEAAAPKDTPGAAEAVAAGLVDGLFRSGNLGGYIKQIRRPGSTGLARTSLRNMAPACEGFVVPATTASALPDASAAPSASASAAPSAPAAPELLAGAPQPDAFAIVFGVEQYKVGPPSPGARSDAEKVTRLVTRTLGVPDAHVKTALDQKADRLAIDLNLEWLKLNVPRGGRVYFYFAGNGTASTSPGSAALVPHDGDPKTGAKTILVSALLASLSETKAADTFLILDAAFAGPGRSAPAKDTLVAALKPLTASPRTAIFSAVTSAEGARATPEGGVFTRYLLEGLGHGRADANADGRITLQEAHSWISPRVSRAAKKESRTQTPSITTGPSTLPPDKLPLTTGLETP